MNTMKEILTVCGVAGIGMFFGYVLGFVEGKVEGRRQGIEEGKNKAVSNINEWARANGYDTNLGDRI